MKRLRSLEEKQEKGTISINMLRKLRDVNPFRHHYIYCEKSLTLTQGQNTYRSTAFWDVMPYNLEKLT
jgi:hypothetical protein